MEQAGGHDIDVIRPQRRLEDVQFQGEGFAPERLAKIKKALRTLHTLELMAQTIYRYQITRKRSELNRQLIAAMCNEMGHSNDFAVALYSYGFTPSLFRWAYWIVGFVFGFGSRLLGTRWILKTGIWVESKAVHHYGLLLKEVEWDDDTRKVIEKDRADEDGHVNRWRGLLGEG